MSGKGLVSGSYALCIMSNHVHYLLEPKESQDLPKIMHWLNWYTAMCFNRDDEPHWPLLGKALSQHRISQHGQAASTQYLALHSRQSQGGQYAAGWFYDFSNYGNL